MCGVPALLIVLPAADDGCRQEFLTAAHNSARRTVMEAEILETGQRWPTTLHEGVLPMTVKTDGYYYTTYRAENPGYLAETFQCAEDVVAQLISQQTDAERPGMLLGKVQSGKTRAFMTVLSLAFDNGYDLAIVLSKNSKALIKQTFERLSKEFATFRNSGRVEVYDILATPANFSSFQLKVPHIFVSKKEKRNLDRLISMVTANEAFRGKRVLIIDDEADSATVGYRLDGGEVIANCIAEQVSELREALGSVSFLQVTATPYSLYLQPTDIVVENVLEFRPLRPAFTVLAPVPDAYVGGETYFGENSRSDEPTVERMIHHEVDHEEFDKLKKADLRVVRGQNVLTTPGIAGYRAAMVNFLVGGCMLRILGHRAGTLEPRLRYSLLVHSEAGKAAHKWQEDVAKLIFEQLGEEAKSVTEVFGMLLRTSYQDLAASMRLAGRDVPSYDEVEAMVITALHDGWVGTAVVNSDQDVAAFLDHEGQLRLARPFNVFVGGQAIDRGVTLANLIGFYYGRRPNRFQQDTVLQHSRMYGYRRDHLPVTRFYTSQYLWYAMADMEDFDSSLRDAIVSGGDREVQFIRQSENGRIVPCSPNRILVADTQTIRPGKRLVPFGFQTRDASGARGVNAIVAKIDQWVRDRCGFGARRPVEVPYAEICDILDSIAETLEFDAEARPFSWDSTKAVLRHLCTQGRLDGIPGGVLVWAADGRTSARKAGEGSHAIYVETPDSTRTEGRIADEFALEMPILFLLRQNGTESQGWRNTPFYWPVIRAQKSAKAAVYTPQVVGDEPPPVTRRRGSTRVIASRRR